MATALMRSAVATELPPYFCTTRAMRRVFSSKGYALSDLHHPFLAYSCSEVAKHATNCVCLTYSQKVSATK